MELKNDKEIVKFLVAERKRKDINQESMAGNVGLKRSTYGHIENGRTRLTAEVLLKACEALDIKVLLVNGENILK